MGYLGQLYVPSKAMLVAPESYYLSRTGTNIVLQLSGSLHTVFRAGIPSQNSQKNHMKKNPFLCKLIPPAEKLQEALTVLFQEPRFPLVLYILKQYTGLQWEEFRGVQKFLDLRNSPEIIMKLCANELATQTREFRLDLGLPHQA